MERVSVVIPSFNVEKSIYEVVKRIPKDIFEKIVVDDGSKDKTGETAEKAGAKVVTHEVNYGKGRAMRTGASLAKGEIIVFLDADLQHMPEDIDKLVEPIQKGRADITIGSRFLGDTKSMPIVRKLSNTISTALIRIFFGLNIKDTQSGYRAIKRDLLNKMHLESDRYNIETEILSYVGKFHMKVEEVPIETIYGDEKSHFTALDIPKFIYLLFYLKFYKMRKK
ncbi:MAG: glycosyltransferase family 2 protein [Candidatus Methanofastidiosum sp.]|nr:glycosyltransferase family 2 protein [Methanofastidiosum sp.]